MGFYDTGESQQKFGEVSFTPEHKLVTTEWTM